MATTSEDVWRLLAELATAQKETDKQLKETDLLLKEVSQQQQENAQQQKKTDKQLKELGQQIGGLGAKFGSFTEGLAFPQWKRFSDNALVWKLLVPVCGPVKKDNT